jgi:hypothetical protein
MNIAKVPIFNIAFDFPDYRDWTISHALPDHKKTGLKGMGRKDVGRNIMHSLKIKYVSTDEFSGGFTKTRKH